MKIVALEEHMTTAEIRRAWADLPPDLQDDSLATLNQFGIGESLEHTDERRLESMDDMGVDVQVLSLTVPGLHNFEPAVANDLALHVNNEIANAVTAHPDRFEGFAALPTPDPQRAADELERTVEKLGFKGALIHGRTRQRNMDAPEFEPIYAMAAKLDVPLYLHPQLPVRAVRDALYGGFAKPLEVFFASGGLGWHYEAGLQFIRLVLSGTFDRYPSLQIILGHWGEVVLSYMERIQTLDVAVKLDRPIRDYFTQNAYYTPGGILSQRFLQQTVEIVGAERVMFATDYPFVTSFEKALPPERTNWVGLERLTGGGCRRFLENAKLSEVEKELIAHGNWDRLSSRLSASR